MHLGLAKIRASRRARMMNKPTQQELFDIDRKGAATLARAIVVTGTELMQKDPGLRLFRALERAMDEHRKSLKDLDQWADVIQHVDQMLIRMHRGSKHRHVGDWAAVESASVVIPRALEVARGYVSF